MSKRILLNMPLTLANLSGIFIARLFDQSFKFSIQSASNEMLWTTVPKEKARKAKPIIDSSIKSIAEGIVGITIYFIMNFSFFLVILICEFFCKPK